MWSLRGGGGGSDKERIARLLELKRIKEIGGDYEAVLSGVSSSSSSSSSNSSSSSSSSGGGSSGSRLE